MQGLCSGTRLSFPSSLMTRLLLTWHWQLPSSWEPLLFPGNRHGHEETLLVSEGREGGQKEAWEGPHQLPRPSPCRVPGEAQAAPSRSPALFWTPWWSRGVRQAPGLPHPGSCFCLEAAPLASSALCGPRVALPWLLSALGRCSLPSMLEQPLWQL